jgi:hypothetical protein
MLQLPEQPPKLRQFGQEDHDFKPLLVRRGVQAAGKFRTRRDRTSDPGLRPDNRPVADFEMIDDAYLAGQGDASADPSAPGDAHLGGDDAVLTDYDVVSDLHEIIELGAPADHGAAEGGTVYGGIGADLYVVMNFYPTGLRDFQPLGASARIAEAIAADYCPGVNNHPIADFAAVSNDHIRMQFTILAHFHSFAQEHSRIKCRARAHAGPFAHESVGKDGHVGAERCLTVNIGEGTYLRGKNGSRSESFMNLGKGKIWIGDFQVILAQNVFRCFSSKAANDDDRAGSAGREMRMVPCIGQESYVAGPGFFDRRNSMNSDTPVPNHLPANFAGQLGECLPWVGHLLLVRPL